MSITRPMTVPTPTQARILQSLAGGAKIVTTQGLHPRAWIFAETFEGVLGVLRYTVPRPTLLALERHGWLINCTLEYKRWHGSTYRISRKGRAALHDVR